MKKLKLFVLPLALFIGSLTMASAQPHGGEKGQGFSPEKRAEKQTADMTEKLSLSEAQAAKVKEINLKYAAKMKEARESAGGEGDRQAMREKMTAMRTEQDAELKKVMTSDQWANWEKIREEQQQQRKDKRPKKEKE